ncbi:MAG: ABC transporter substrate-binding protein [Chloroflexota bacterium]
MSESPSVREVTRRRFLTIAAASAALPALAACQGGSAPAAQPAESKPASKPTEAAKPAAPAAAPAATQAPAAAAPTQARVVPGQAGAAAPAKPAGGKVTALTFQQENSFIPAFDEHFKTVIIPKFKQETGIDLTFDGVSVGGLQAKITAEVETNSGPDVSMMAFNWPLLYDQKLQDVTDIADEMGKWGGGWLDNIKEAVVSNGRWKAIPLGNIGQQMVYRIDWFKEVGYDKFPETWEELLEAGTKLKEKGRPFGMEYGYGFGDNHGWMYPLLWSYGGREMDKDGKTVVLDSAETAKSVDFARTFFEKTQLQDVLGWTDVNNNRAFLAEQISCTNNATSILQTAEKEFPQLAENIGHAANPKGPTGERYSLLNSWAFGAFSFSPDPAVAKSLLKFLTREDIFSAWITAANGYYVPFLKKFENDPMWEKQPKFKPYKETVAQTHLPGWPAANSRAASESLAKYVVVNMYLNAAKGMSTKEAISTAAGQLKEIYGRA